jgi:phosphatidylserine/phosphatidylglycerophosphate/cardiolipin synthase-like enzyme
MQNRQNRHNYRRRLLDDTFNLEKSYFYQEISSSDLNSIKKFMSSYISNNNTDYESLRSFFSIFPNLNKGEHNLKKLKQAFYDVADECKESENFFNSFKSLNEFIHNEYMVPKPTVMEVLFFPSQSNEVKLANMIRTCKKSLYICVYTISNDVLAEAIEEAYERGIEVKIVTDDECCKNYGSDIYRLAAMVRFLLLIF